MRTSYDPSEMPQVYYKKLQTGQVMIIQLNVTCHDKTMIRLTLQHFQKQMDINDAADRWKEKETIINRIQAMVPLTAPLFWVLFFRGISPSKNGRIAPS
jgi:hypothetical protein